MTADFAEIVVQMGHIAALRPKNWGNGLRQVTKASRKCRMKNDDDLHACCIPEEK